MLLVRIWGQLPNRAWRGLLPGPSGPGPERELRGGPPSRMFSTERYVWSGPRAACRHGNKTEAVAAAGARPGWGLDGGGEVGLESCCLGNRNSGVPPLHPGHGPSANTVFPSLVLGSQFPDSPKFS
jgi:hypothetical protein